MFWFTLILWAVSFVANEVMAAQAAKENSQKPSKLGDFTFPTADENRRIPWLWGKTKQKGPNVVWYGNLRQKAKKVKSGLFSKTTVGYHYYLSIQFALGKGPIVLRKVWYGETLVWSGTQSVEGTIDINKPPQYEADPHWPTWLSLILNLFYSIHTVIHAYNKVPSGILRFHPGDFVQTPDDFLEYFQTPCPAYRGLGYCVFDGYIGESTSPEPWYFEIERIPNGLALADPKVGTEDDANPMNVAYEIFTDVYGYAGADIDTTGWATAAATLKTEVNGFSWMKDSPSKASVVIKEIEKQIAGHFHLDAVTGQWQIELVRDDYDIDDLPELNEDNVTECMLFSRGTWTGSTNEVYIEFANRGNDYNDASSKAQDLANMAIQGSRIPMTMVLPGVKIPVLAGDIAWRELRSLSYPLAIARVKTNRSMWNGFVGMAVKYNYDVDVPIAMRITKINTGSTDNGPIEVDLVQDVFASASAAFSTPDSGWTPPVYAMSEFTDQQILEAPYAIVRRAESTDPTRIWTMAADQYDGADGYDILVDDASSGQAAGLTPLGSLSGDITQTDTTIDIVTDNVEVSQFVTATAASIGQNLVNLVMIGDELIAPTSVVSTATGLQLVGCYRGLCDTAQAVHADAVSVWVVCIGASLNDFSLTPGATIDVKLVPSSTDTSMAPGDVTAIPVTLSYREDRPYPPSLLAVGTAFPATIDIDSGVTITFNRRDWRIYDEVSQLAVDAATLDPTFPAADSTQYAGVVYSSGTEVYVTSFNAGAASVSVGLKKILRYCDGCPVNVELGVRTQHNHAGLLASLQDLRHSATTVSVHTDDSWLGVLDTYQTSLPWTAPADGNYGFTIDVALAADLQVKVNGGALVTIIAAGNTSGTLNGVVAGDIIEVRHLDSASSDEVLLKIDAPTVTTDAFAILIFENVYWTIGGFGRLGFGTGPFGR